ncbi:hypothetical protein M419DRAFT_72334 [Trichoderma reesei RUT C-30]|uniref:Uncharacterized protein n=1 Tax=Hypocrea jecorina (strain ATCC 56765 / BCRC 32924 / NRRL 11460 / Rut C-30) TaxID=1344414 RepID=A0A024SHG1_HYPJR|nr:hypothetical protein M419DRAFT_72334 [Trichoderma reesei RUT C-30]
MAIRYTAEHLLFLRESPLCVKPEKLPPAEEWMGTNRPTIGLDLWTIRSLTRPLAALVSIILRGRVQVNPEDIVFAPPRMAFASSGRGSKTLDGEKPTKDADTTGRFALRNRNSEADGDRLRAPNAARRRGENDQDNEGWSTVKPRKSFGAEGAERFHGRMGGNFRDEKKPLREPDREVTRDRSTRAFDPFARDTKDADNDARTRTTAGRSKVDSWHKSESTTADLPIPERRERDRTRSWRDRDTAEAADDRTNGRAPDRRWARDREQRVEREPEWFDEPAEVLREAHTQQDFQKWMEQMKKGKGGGDSSAPAAAPAAPEPAQVEKPQPPPSQPSTVEARPDKFFMAFGLQSPLEPNSPPTEISDAAAVRPKTVGKSSRFTSFFHQPQEEQRNRAEQSTSVPPASTQFPPGLGPLSSLASPPEEEKQAFQQLLLKLQKQKMSATPPASSPFSPPSQGNPLSQGIPLNLTSPEPFHQYGGERINGGIGRPPPPQHVQEILAPRPQQQTARPDQLLQDLVGHHQRISSQSSGMPDQARNNNNTEFLMNLMRMGPSAPLNMPQPQQQPQPQPQQQMQKQIPLQESEFSPREARGVQQRQMRPQPPPGFPMDESFHNADRDSRLGQPTQILQRPPPPPGLDQMPPSWMTSGGQMPPPQQRGPMMPPPGLPGGLNRNVPMPHMFPPNFPPGAMPPPDAMAGMPPRNMPPPPPGFFNGPPHGFMPPGLGGYNGPPGPPEAFGGSPFEARGMPPGAAGRGAAFGRP